MTEFVSHTGSDPGLARDILQTANWDIHRAYNIYNDLKSSSSSSSSTTGKSRLQPHLNTLDRLEEDFCFPPAALSDSASLELVVEVDDHGEKDDGVEDPPSPSSYVDQRCIDCIKADNVVNQTAQSSQVRLYHQGRVS